MSNGDRPPVKLGQGVVFRPGTAFDERWAPHQFLSGFVTSISGEDASIVVFPDVYAPFYEMRVKRDDSLSEDRTWTPSVGEDQTMPEAPSDGQIYGRRNQSWTPISGEDQGFVQAVIVSDTVPSGILTGLAWFDTTINNFYVFEQGHWVEPAHINPPEEVSVNVVPPFITGVVALDELLTCSTGDWSSQPISFTFQWMSDGAPLTNQTTNHYTISVTDVTHRLTCVVTATNKIGISQPATSNIISVLAPELTVAPIIGGSVVLGGLLSVTNGSWNSSSGITFTYQWMRGAAPIAGETTSVHTIVAPDIGTNLTCVVTATNLIGASTATSNVVAITVPSIMTAPVISGGVLFTGTVLTCSTGVWSSLPSSFTYQWRRGATPISGATTSTYVLTTTDLSQNITCNVTATNGIGASTPATSNTLTILTATAFSPATLQNATLSANVSGHPNLVVRLSSPATGGVRSAAYKNGGKWQFDLQVQTIAGLSSGTGLITSAGLYQNVVTSPPQDCVIVRQDGTVWAGGQDFGRLGDAASGDFFSWVIDMDNWLFWVRRNNELWNGDISPQAVPGVSGGLPFPPGSYTPFAVFGGLSVEVGETTIAAFGSIPLLNVVSGFVPGWPN